MDAQVVRPSLFCYTMPEEKVKGGFKGEKVEKWKGEREGLN